MAQDSNTLTAADMPRATRMPREIPRTTTTSLYDSELLRRSFSLDSADSVSEAELISYFVGQKKLGGGEKNPNSLMGYGSALIPSSRDLMKSSERGRIQRANALPSQTV